MQVIQTEISAVRRVVTNWFIDERSWFSKTFQAGVLAAAAITDSFLQDNQSFSAQVGTVRELHPAVQAKLVRVLTGAIINVAVDLRQASLTYGRHMAIRLDADGGEQHYMQAGFAHGLCTLEPDTMVAYKVSAYYSREHDRNLIWNGLDLTMA